METTLEIRWFIEGIPPVEVQKWFKDRCSGKLLGSEIREDWYFYGDRESIEQFIKIPSYSLEEINLKLRSGNLELKLRQQQLGTEKFGSWQGKIEQWSKPSQPELKQLLIAPPIESWIRVVKEREQKIEQNVKSELTRLSINSNFWWSVAFEMPQDNSDEQLSHFKQIVNDCASVDTIQLYSHNSYSYSQWIEKLSKLKKF